MKNMILRNKWTENFNNLGCIIQALLGVADTCMLLDLWINKEKR